MLTTPKLGLKKLELTDSPPDITLFNANWDVLDEALLSGEGIQFLEGVFVARPAPGIISRYYFATDKGEIYRDNGTAWVLAAASKTSLDNHLADGTAHLIGDKATLLTTAKNSIVAAINELFQFASDGKSLIAAAITGMGQTASSSETWSQLVGHIADISDDADATVSDVLSGKTFYQGGSKRTGTMPDNGGSNWITGQSARMNTDVGYIQIKPTAGYYDGSSNNYVQYPEPDLISSNIVGGIDILGIVGSFLSNLAANYVVASGNSISKGDKVSINSEGKVTNFNTHARLKRTFPSIVYEGSDCVFNADVCALSPTSGVIVYNRYSESSVYSGYLLAYTDSGGMNLSFGNPTSFPGGSGSTDYFRIEKFSSSAVVVSHITTPRFRLYTLSGTTITAQNYIEVGSYVRDFRMLEDNLGIVIYKNSGTYVACVTLSGTTMSLGTPVQLSSTTNTGGCIIPISATKALAVYNNSSGTVVTELSVSGTTITTDTTTVLSAVASTNYFTGELLSSNLAIVSFQGSAQAIYLKAFQVTDGVVGTLGTTYSVPDYNVSETTITKLDSLSVLLVTRNEDRSGYCVPQMLSIYTVASDYSISQGEYFYPFESIPMYNYSYVSAGKLMGFVKASWLWDSNYTHGSLSLFCLEAIPDGIALTEGNAGDTISVAVI